MKNVWTWGSTLVRTLRPDLNAIRDSVIAVWPEHAKFLAASFDSRTASELDFSERLASKLRRIIAERMESVVDNYRWCCERINEEVLHFARTGKYRLASARQAEAEIYSNSEYMGRYMDGLLLTQLLWVNQFRGAQRLIRLVKESFATSFSFVEIGPGHGLLLHTVAESDHCTRAEGWDISASSLAITEACAEKLGLRIQPQYRRVDIVDDNTPCANRFDLVIVSEVLEHLDDPVAALRNIGRILKDDGKVFINVPINSPAPDHIYLLESIDDARGLIREASLDIVSEDFYPMTGYSLEKARKRRATISCVIVAQLSKSISSS